MVMLASLVQGDRGSTLIRYFRRWHFFGLYGQSLGQFQNLGRPSPPQKAPPKFPYQRQLFGRDLFVSGDRDPNKENQALEKFTDDQGLAIKSGLASGKYITLSFLASIKWIWLTAVRCLLCQHTYPRSKFLITKETLYTLGFKDLTHLQSRIHHLDKVKEERNPGYPFHLFLASAAE